MPPACLFGHRTFRISQSEGAASKYLHLCCAFYWAFCQYGPLYFDLLTLSTVQVSYYICDDGPWCGWSGSGYRGFLCDTRDVDAGLPGCNGFATLRVKKKRKFFQSLQSPVPCPAARPLPVPRLRILPHRRDISHHSLPQPPHSFPSSFGGRTMLRGGLSIGRRLAFRRDPLAGQLTRRSYATDITDLRQLPQPGDRLNGFTVQRAKSVPELELATVQLVHDKTGADYIHVAREDKNNVFAIGFKTNPDDDTGVPHILEHTTLCGSNKYTYLLPSR